MADHAFSVVNMPPWGTTKHENAQSGLPNPRAPDPLAPTHHGKCGDPTWRVGRSIFRIEPNLPPKLRWDLVVCQQFDGYNHIVGIVMFSLEVNEQGQATPNNFVVTAFFKHIWLKG